MISPFPFDRALYYSSFMCLYLFSLFLLLFIPPSYHNQQEINCSFIIMKICFIFFHYSDFSSIFHFFICFFSFISESSQKQSLCLEEPSQKQQSSRQSWDLSPTRHGLFCVVISYFFQISILSFFFWALQLSIMISIGSSHPGRWEGKERKGAEGYSKGESLHCWRREHSISILLQTLIYSFITM